MHRLDQLLASLGYGSRREVRDWIDAGRVTVRGARANNLKNVELALPVGLFICITGVSGSGKSTLINDTLYNTAAQHLYGSTDEPAAHEQGKTAVASHPSRKNLPGEVPSRPRVGSRHQKVVYLAERRRRESRVRHRS